MTKHGNWEKAHTLDCSGSGGRVSFQLHRSATIPLLPCIAPLPPRHDPRGKLALAQPPAELVHIDVVERPSYGQCPLHSSTPAGRGKPHRVFSNGGEGGESSPPLTAVFPPFRLAVIIVYYIFQKIIHPLPPARTPIFPPFKISLENTLPVIDLSKTLQKTPELYIAFGFFKLLMKR